MKDRSPKDYINGYIYEQMWIIRKILLVLELMKFDQELI